MSGTTATEIVKSWPQESREAAELVIDAHGEPTESTDSLLIWHGASGCKRVMASKTFFAHNFPAPHNDSVTSVIDYAVPKELVAALAEFDGSVMVDATAGEVSARCHDEQANFLALNLVHDIITGAKDAQQARAYYSKEFADYRRKLPTPYMEKLRFRPRAGSADPDARTLSDQDLERAVAEGEQDQDG